MVSGDTFERQSRDWRIWFGVASTAFWLWLGLLYIAMVVGFRDFATQPADALGGFLEERAQQYGVTGLGITDQPNLDMGEYSRRSVRVSLPVVELRPLIEMLADIENSSYPVAIERIQMTGGRMRTGYTVNLGVNAYDRETGTVEQ